MEISDNFRVSTPIEDTWKALLDIEQVAPCLPGAQLQEVEGDEYRGVVKVKVGPITAQYKGTATLAEVDEANRVVKIDAQGRDTRGQGNAKALITVQMAADGDGTKVDLLTDLHITGKVAQFGRGVLADVSTKILGQFVENLERDVLGPTRTAAVPVAGEAGGNGVARPFGEVTPAEAAAADEALAAASAAAPLTPSAGPRRIDSPEAEPVDLLEVAGAPVSRRLVPLGIGILVVAVLFVLVRRRRARRGEA